MKKHFKKIILVTLIMFIALAGLVVFAMETTLKHDPVIKTSKTYDFVWNKYLGTVSLKKDGQTISRFNFRPRPLAVWIYKPTNILAIVTSDDGQVDGAHGLYIYNGKEVKKVYQTERQIIGNNVEIKESIYDFAPTDSGYNANYVMNFSPDGKFLYIPVFGYEGSGSVTISLEKLEVIENIDDTNKLDASGNVGFSPDGECVINFRSYYGDSQTIALGKKSQKGYDLKVLQNSDFHATSLNKIYWDKNCQGIISIMNSDNKLEYFHFDAESYKLTKLNSQPDISVLERNFNVLQENVFYTTKGNSSI